MAPSPEKVLSHTSRCAIFFCVLCFVLHASRIFLCFVLHALCCMLHVSLHHASCLEVENESPDSTPDGALSRFMFHTASAKMHFSCCMRYTSCVNECVMLYTSGLTHCFLLCVSCFMLYASCFMFRASCLGDESDSSNTTTDGAFARFVLDTSGCHAL